MSSNETPSASKELKSYRNKELYIITRKMLYKKYNQGNFSFKNILTDYLIFNYKCRLTLLFKEFLLADNECEFLRRYYTREDIQNILGKILEIYCLYSKIYPNYIILKENKFLYKNIRKKQKMIDEKNKNEEIKNKNDDNGNDNVIYKDYVLFTLSVRNEIKEFQEKSLKKNKKYKDKDNISNTQLNTINTKNTKKINDNWTFVSNKNLNKNVNISKKNSNVKNMSFDSFWTNDTNNLSILLNAINEKIFLDSPSKNKNDYKFKNKRDISYRTVNHKFLKSKNQKRKEIKSTSKKTFKKVIFKKIGNKKTINDNSRNNNFLKTKHKQTFYNNLNTTKHHSSSLSNTHYNQGIFNNGQSHILKHLLTEKNIDDEIRKKINQYYSIQRECCSDKYSCNNLKKIIPPIMMKKKYLIKDISKKNKSLSIKKKPENMLKIINNKYDNIKKNIKKKSQPQEYLKIILDDIKNNNINEKSIKEGNVKDGSFNSKILYNTNNNFNILRNKKHFIKKYFTNNNFIKKNTNANRRYITNLTESNSQTLIISRKEKEQEREKEFSSTSNNYFKKKDKDYNAITLNNCHTTSNYYIVKNKKLNTYINEKNITDNEANQQKTDCGVLAYMRDKILKAEVGKTYIKKKCFSPLSNGYMRRYFLSKSCNIIKNEKRTKIKDTKKNDKLVQRQVINDKISNKLNEIRKNIRKQIIQQDNNNIYEKTYYCNKFNNNISRSKTNLFVMDSSQKENKSNNLMKINEKEKDKFRNNKNVYFRKNFSPTLTYYNLYISNKINLSQPHTNKNISNNSGLNDLQKDNLVIKKNKTKNKKLYNNKNSNNLNNQLSLNKLENKENIFNNINNQNINILNKQERKNYMIKSKTEYEYFKPECNNINNINNLNGINRNEKKNNEINKNFILKRFQKRPTNFYLFSKDKINNNNNINKLKKIILKIKVNMH